MDNKQHSGQLPAYPQTGVASTCRSYREYMDMFVLEEAELRRGAVLDVAGGAASFTAQLGAMGVEAAAADPFYAGEREAVIAAAAREVEVSSAKVLALKDVYDWSYYGSPERHRAMREQSLALFADDFRSAGADRRYVAASLPNLPFKEGTFRTVVCSHFLFLYGDRFDADFHRQAIEEMLRVTAVGGEVRIYPLVTLQWERASFIDNILENINPIAEASFIPGKLPFAPSAGQILLLAKK